MPSHDPDRRALQARTAAATRHNTADRDRLRRELAARKLADYIKQTVDAAPPLTPEQRADLAHLLVVHRTAA